MARKPSMGADRARAGRVALSVPSTFAQYKTLLAKDLQQEFRTKEMLTSMGIYALLVLIVYGAALGQTAQATDVLQLSGGLLWALIVFTSLLGLNRSFNHEKEQGCMEGILLVPMDRSVIFLAKATSNLLFLLVVEVIAVPLFWFFFLTTAQPGPGFMLMAVPLAVGTIGMAGIGTLLSTITVNTRGKDVMLAVLFVPLIDLDGLAARVAEDQVDALGLKRGHHGLRADHLLALFGVFAAQTAGLACGGRVLILLAFAHDTYAPLSAEETNLAYLASTPWLCLGAGATKAARRAAISSSSTCSVMAPPSMSTVIRSNRA